ncbi:hypothetical protein [Arenicella xantha]|uniref:Uncharacterized protein n=1 Tax=Arenicella xantha TaxID=644221 RepID=A0A395JH57_9GAMM|nr:hypothetical protein [Arenicella xantha]RBP47118.1 hypothetical protein DFR28_11081 [Arenicella xantha]
MLIEIVTPVFKCEADQSIFFSRLSGLPNYRRAANRGENIYMSLSQHPKQTALEELQMICHMWGTTFKVVEG